MKMLYGHDDQLLGIQKHRKVHERDNLAVGHIHIIGHAKESVIASEANEGHAVIFEDDLWVGIAIVSEKEVSKSPSVDDSIIASIQNVYNMCAFGVILLSGPALGFATKSKIPSQEEVGPEVNKADEEV